jgi:two-component system, OmpR family, sensor histidine kinase SenX3
MIAIVVAFVVALVALVALGVVTSALVRTRRSLPRQLADAAQASARESERDRRRLELALDATTDGVVVVDANGDVVLRNGPAGRFHAARHSDLLAEEKLGELLSAACRSEAGEREVQLFGPPPQTLHVYAHPLLHEHAIVGAVAFVRDVSTTRRVEHVRRDFVANVSHELKTPIGALALLAETIASGTDDPDVTKRLAERVVREAVRLGNIVDDLLGLSLLEAQERPTREPVPLPLLLGEAVDQVRAAADVAGVPLSIVAPVPGAELVCDRRQVLSAVVNLLENAVKYSEPGEPVEVAAQLDGDRVRIDVRDHGIGIPKRDLERIFERFYRVDRARGRQTGGTGLGLSIVRHVAQAHGGEVTVESVEGEGSTFSLLLPDAHRAVPLEPGDPQTRPNGHQSFTGISEAS